MKHLLLTSIAAVLVVGCASPKGNKVNVTYGKDKTGLLKKEETEKSKSPETPEPSLESKPSRPRTVAEALYRQKYGIRPDKSPFGDYDTRLIAALQTRWNQILDQGYLPQVGEVVVTFSLWSDGKITNVKVESSTASPLNTVKCERAVKGASPYEPWPEKMRDEIGSDRRFVRFTFYYR
jgi:outer membrane biosynthesis protein TonB